MEQLREYWLPISPMAYMDKLASQPAISPDGKLIASRYREAELSPFKLGLIDFATGKTVKTVDLAPAVVGCQLVVDGGGADVAVQVLPVLDQHRRPRRRATASAG